MSIFFFSPKTILADNGSSICKKINLIEIENLKQKEKVRKEIKEAREKRSIDIKDKWLARENKFTENRQETDNFYKKKILELKTKAKTSEEEKILENFEKEVLSLLQESRFKIDAILEKYIKEILISLSKQDSKSEEIFKEIENEIEKRTRKIKNLCALNRFPEVKDEIDFIKKYQNTALTKNVLIRKSKLEIENLIEIKNKEIATIKNTLKQRILELYLALPENLR